MTNLVNLTGVPLEENEMLYEEYLSILEEVKTARENALFGSGKAEDSRTDRMWKFAGGAFLWVIIAVVLLFSKKKENNVHSNTGLTTSFLQLFVWYSVES